ncbi:tubulin polymerization-promoting protein family member 3-like isoform X2 [Hyla sarda]|nr:tubulin polymerization-promoting protein family member 3-like isoform X2 [Hyla sarda]XP_056384595.1 tubulin polymerization-promoting protein family member 3-like isoform X2 [Hyla sarda]
MSQELEKTFRKYAVYGIPKATGNEMTGKNFSKLCKECNIQENGCTSTDVDIVFAKTKGKAAHVITYEEFQMALNLLSAKRFHGIPANEAIAAIHKLVEGKEPANIRTTKAVTAGAVDRLTNTSKYTGSHKERFDESGKGKGLAGREELTDGCGYVGAYKGEGTYDKKSKK